MHSDFSLNSEGLGAFRFFFKHYLVTSRMKYQMVGGLSNTLILVIIMFFSLGPRASACCLVTRIPSATSQCCLSLAACGHNKRINLCIMLLTCTYIILTC